MNLLTPNLTQLAWTQLWQITALALAVGLLVRLSCRRRPHLAYALWTLVLVKCLTPPLWSSPTGIFSWAQLQRVEQPAPTDDFAFAGMPATPEPFAGPDEEGATAAATTAPAPPRPTPPKPNPLTRADYLALTWLAGAALLTAWLAAKSLATRRWLARCSTPADSRWQALTDDLCRRLGLRRSVRLLTTDASLGPAAFGLLRPRILLPAALLERKPLAQIEPLLAHELMHVRRRDPAVGKLQLLAQILWWFHPLLWWTNRELRRHRERACDEEVLARLPCPPALYARTLLDLLTWRRALRPAFAFPGLRPWEVTSQRLEHIMQKSQRFHRHMPRWCWVLLAAATTFVLPGAGFTLPSTPTESNRLNPPASGGRKQPLQTVVKDVASNRPFFLCLDISPDSSTLVAGGAGLDLYDAASGDHRGRRFASRPLTRAVKFSPTNNRLFASGSDDGVVRVWDVSEPNPVRAIQGHAGTVHDLAFSPDGKQLASCSTQYADGRQQSAEIRIWSLDDGELLYEQTLTESAVRTVAFSPDATLFACCVAPATQNGLSKVVVFGTGDWKPVREIPFSPGSGLDLAFTADSTKLIIGGGICVPITDTSCQPTGKVWIADLAADGPARLLNIDESQYFRSVSVTPGGDRFAAGTAVGRDRLSPSGRKSGWALIAQIQMRDVATGQVIWSQDGGLGDPYGVTVSRDGKPVAACSDGKILLFDAAHGALVRTVEGAQFTLPHPDDGESPLQPMIREHDAIAAVAKLGGTLQRDEQAPGKPVVKVVLDGTGADDATLESLKALTELKELFLGETKVTDAGLIHLRAFPKLEKLYLHDNNISDAGIDHLKRLTTLRELALTRASITDTGLIHLEHLTNLEKLGIDSCKQITGSGLRHLHRLKKLRALYLGGTPVSDASLIHLAGMTDLELLILWSSNQSGAGLVHLEGLAKLRHLDLNSNRHLSDVGLDRLRALTALERLGVANTPVTGAFFKHLKHLKDHPKLRSLVLRGSRINDAAMKHIKDLPHLESLMVDNTDVTDAGIAELHGLTNIRRLDVGSNPAVTDASVEHLKTLTGLEYLALSQSGISQAGIDELRRAFPNVKGL